MCNNCGQETKNPKFCSRSCAAVFNNKAFPKRQRMARPRGGRHCRQCKVLLPDVTYSGKLCEDCSSRPEWFGKNYTVGELRERHKHYGRWNIHSSLRGRASDTLKRLGRLDNCAQCGYDKHVETAHIRSVASFPDTAWLSEINDPSNLIGLCPNCHWEFDHGLLLLDNIAL